MEFACFISDSLSKRNAECSFIPRILLYSVIHLREIVSTLFACFDNCQCFWTAKLPVFKRAHEGHLEEAIHVPNLHPMALSIPLHLAGLPWRVLFIGLRNGIPDNAEHFPWNVADE